MRSRNFGFGRRRRQDARFDTMDTGGEQILHEADRSRGTLLRSGGPPVEADPLWVRIAPRTHRRSRRSVVGAIGKTRFARAVAGDREEESACPATWLPAPCKLVKTSSGSNALKRSSLLGRKVGCFFVYKDEGVVCEVELGRGSRSCGGRAGSASTPSPSRISLTACEMSGSSAG